MSDHIREARAILAVLIVCLSASCSERTAARSISPIWRVHVAGWGTPAADASTAYFLSKQHEVLAINAKTGELRWRHSTDEPGEASAGPGVVLAGSSVVAGDYDIIALDRKTGTVRWRFAPLVGYGPGLYLGSASNETVFAGSPSARVYAIDQETGRLRWSTAIGAEQATTAFQPAFDDGVLAVGYTTFTAPTAGGVVLLDGADGRVLWRRAFPPVPGGAVGTGLAGGPLFAGRLVIAASSDGQIHAFDRTTGSIEWSLPAADNSLEGVPSRSQDFRALTRSGGTLFAGSLSGLVIAYDLQTQRRKWVYRGYGSTGFRIASDGANVYVPNLSGHLTGLDALTGAEVWRVGGSEAGFIWAPAVLGAGRFLVSGLQELSAFGW